MTRVFYALLVALCLTACGPGQMEQSNETPQKPHLSEQGAQSADPAQNKPPVTADAGQPAAGGPETSETGSQEAPMLKITVGDYALSATFEDNSSAEAFQALLAQGPVTVEMEDYGGFEKVGPLGTALPRNDTQITTQPGDVILYQGDQITIYYGTNTWSFTRLARIDDPTGLQEKLGNGTVCVTFSLV